MWYRQNRKNVPSLNSPLAEHGFLGKPGKVTIFGPPTILTLPYDSYRQHCEWERSKPEENWGTLVRIWHSKMVDDCRQTRVNWTLPEEFKIGKFHHEKIPLTPTKLTQWKKPIYPCTAVHGHFGNFGPFPNSCLGINQLPVWLHDADWPKGSPIKFLGEIPPGEYDLWISEFPHYKPTGKWALDTDMLALRCQRQLWKFGYKGNFF